MRLRCLVDNRAAEPGYRTEHGLSLLIETLSGRVLFDTGASGTVLLHNMAQAGVTLDQIDALVLSHGHRDHTGGLRDVLERRPGLPLYAHPDLFRARFSLQEGEYQPRGMLLSEEEVRRLADVRLSVAPQEVLPGVWTTGEITARAEPEGRSPHHWVRNGEEWVPDPYRDDMGLVLETCEGLVVVCGCCHAGLLNTLLHVRRVFGVDLAAVVGGLHLVDADEAHLRRVVTLLDEMGAPRLYANHCTGERAMAVLEAALGRDRVVPLPAGASVCWPAGERCALEDPEGDG